VGDDGSQSADWNYQRRQSSSQVMLPYTAHHTLYAIHCTPYTALICIIIPGAACPGENDERLVAGDILARYILYTIDFLARYYYTLYVPYVPYIPFSPYSPYAIHYTRTLYTMHHTPYTIRHTLYIVHHTPYTIHHAPYIAGCSFGGKLFKLAPCSPWRRPEGTQDRIVHGGGGGLRRC
jgi:hypothetical protein